MFKQLFGYTCGIPTGENSFVLGEGRSLRPTSSQAKRVWHILLAPGGDHYRNLYRDYNPLTEETGLFRIFADTEPTPQGCQQFANCYGMLGKALIISTGNATELVEDGIWINNVHPRKLSVTHNARSPRLGEVEIILPANVDRWVDLEVLDLWYIAIRTMNHLVMLWDLARSKKVDQLAKWVKITKNQICFPLPYPWKECDYLPVNMSGFGLPSKIDGVIPAALFYVQKHLNDNLGNQAAPLLIWDHVNDKPALQILPQNLWACMCLQFAQAIDGNKNYQRCPACSRWFELYPGVNRANRQTCTDSCRVRLHRLRQERAWQLHCEGKPLREIAKELHSTVKTVKGWIAKKER